MMKRPLLLVVIAIAAVGLDQLIKYLVETGMEMHERIELLPVLSLFRIPNTGIAFSMFSGSGNLFLVVMAAAVMGFVTWLSSRTEPHQAIARMGFALVLAGAAGNLIDRALLGYVVDYILFHIGNWSFAVFNLADAFITVGALLVVVEELLAWRRPVERNPDDRPPGG